MPPPEPQIKNALALLEVGDGGGVPAPERGEHRGVWQLLALEGAVEVRADARLRSAAVAGGRPAATGVRLQHGEGGLGIALANELVDLVGLVGHLVVPLDVSSMPCLERSARCDDRVPRPEGRVRLP